MYILMPKNNLRFSDPESDQPNVAFFSVLVLELGIVNKKFVSLFIKNTQCQHHRNSYIKI